MDLRQAKALEIAARVRLTFQDGYWRVPSQSGTNPYKVVLKASDASCTCEDFQLRRQHCKHIMAVRLVLERECGGSGPAIDTDTPPLKKTYRQHWPAYNEAQMTEKSRLQVLLHALCLGLESPERPSNRPGRKPVSPADAVFACVFKVYSTFSSRRFNGDLAAAYEKGYLSRPLHPNKVNTFLENAALTPVLSRLIIQSSLPLREVETVFAPDSTGFSVSRFIRWTDEKYGPYRSGRDWVKAHAICGVKSNIVTAVRIEGRDAADCPHFKPLVETTAQNFTVREVPADKAYLSRENLEAVAALGGTAFVPFKSNSSAGEPGSLWEKMFHYYAYRRDEFLEHYHQRSNAESTFSMIKAKFGASIRSRTEAAKKNETLCKFLCHNICIVHQSHVELGLQSVFGNEEKVVAAEAPAILPLSRHG